ncbi:MAG: HEAT repeat domain-containing protein [Gemmatimonadota bacterium]|nr:HEAT repeat domain-containing protein [Gemmatimonadota bacterium]
MTASLLLLLIKATVILVAALGITIAMQRTSATARHLVWLVTLGGLLLVPALTAWSPLRVAVLPATSYDFNVSMGDAPRIQLPPVPLNDGQATIISSSGVAILATPDGSSINASQLANRTKIARATTTFPRLGWSSISLVVAVWGAVVVAILLSLAWAGMSVRRIVRNARPLDSADWMTPLFEIADRIGLDDAPRLLQSTEAKMPFACGIMRPTIVLPAESESWTLDRRRAVLLHELAHVRRHDLLGHTLGRLACAVYWFHPLVWTAAKRLRSESERACDDLALACGTRATDYAEHLLDIVTSVRGDSTPLVALAMARRKEFEGRMLAILDPDLRHSTPSRRQSAALIAALALISITVGAIAPVARTAEAAVAVAAPRPQIVAAPAAVEAPALSDAPLRIQAPAYPDSGVPGVVSKRTSFAQSMRTSMSTSQAMSQSTSQGTSAERFDSDPESLLASSVNALSAAGAQVGISAAASALQALGLDTKGFKGAKGSKGGDDRAMLLARVLKSDTSASLRRIAAWGLQEYAETPVASEALAGALRHDTDWHVREMAAWALGESNHQAVATDALIAALKGDAEERVRVTTAWALGEHDDGAAVDALSAALADPSYEIRQRAAWSIGNISPKQAPKQLVAALRDKDARTRRVVAWALYNIEDVSTAPAIESALKVEQDANVQLAMIRSLAVLGEQSVDALKGLLESPDPRIKGMAVRALAGGRAAGPWPWPWPNPRPFP